MKAEALHSATVGDVAWFQSLPEHWNAQRLKTVASYFVSNVDKVAAENEQPVRLCNYTDVYHNDIISPDMGLMETTATAEEISKFGLEVHDVVITKDSEDWRDIAVPALVVETAPDFVCGYHLAVIRPKANLLYGPYLLRLLQSTAVNHQFQIASSGVTRYGLPKPAIGEAWLPLPPLSEQYVIAAFLNERTVQIDILIAKKQQLIHKLKEKRGALITRIVTRGLPPEVATASDMEPHPKMKDTGVEWLGDVPTHWAVKQLKWAIMFQRGHDLSSEHREEGSVPLVTSAGVSATHNVAIAKGPGIVTGRYGTIGQFHLVNEDYWPLNTTLYSIDLYGNSPSFLRYMLEHLSPLVVLHSVKSAVPGVDRNDLHPTRVALPPVVEQHVIAAYLDRETRRLDNLAAKVESATTRLTEYRQALITSAVTGQIDVRHWQAPALQAA